MKAKLLKELRYIGREQVHILSITRENGISVGMSYSFNDECYSDLFYMGDTEDDVKERAMKIYFENHINNIREKYKKYTRKYKCRKESELCR